MVDTKPFTLDTVMEYIDALSCLEEEKESLKQMINDIADTKEQTSLEEVKMTNERTGILDTRKHILYHCWMTTSFAEKIGLYGGIKHVD